MRGEAERKFFSFQKEVIYSFISVKDAEITEQRFSMCWFTLEIAAMAGTPPGNGRLIWVSHISSGVKNSSRLLLSSEVQYQRAALELESL